VTLKAEGEYCAEFVSRLLKDLERRSAMTLSRNQIELESP